MLRDLAIVASLLIVVLLCLSRSVVSQESVIDRPINLDKTRDRNVPVTFHLPDRKEPAAQPLVIFSHGAAGTRDGLFALASETARQGYVVMCLEHVTSNLDAIRSRMRAGRLGFKGALIACGQDEVPRRNRPLDVRFAIDLAEKLNRDGARLEGRMDLSKIAILGHSYGAYTAMACCGVKPVEIAGDLTEPRIKLGIALSPQAGNGHFFDETSFVNVRVPFVGITGTKDMTRFIASIDERRDFFELMPRGDKHLLWIHDAGHFSFSDSTGSGRRAVIPPDRDVTQALKTIVPSILDAYLRGEPALDEAARKALVSESLGGTVQRIEWEVR